MGSRETGQTGESVACDFLKRKGYIILKRNYSKPWGEIDIIALKEDVVHFVEVKTVTREKPADGSRVTGNYRPEEMAHEHKLRKVARTAELYMVQKRDMREYQIDVIAVDLYVNERRAVCRLYSQVL